MAGFFYEMEKIIAKNSDSALELALHYYGQELSIYRPMKTDRYSDVYGKQSSGNLNFIETIEGILQSDDFSTSDGMNDANFEEGFLYTKSTDSVLVGDVIKVGRRGGTREFLVEAKENIGYSTEMFVKFKISNRN